MAIYADKKISELIYYPTFNTEKYNKLKNNLNQADIILIDTCDLACEPIALNCQKQKSAFINLLKENFNQEKENKINSCQQFIFRK